MRQVFIGWGVAVKRKASKRQRGCLRYIFRTRCYMWEHLIMWRDYYLSVTLFLKHYGGVFIMQKKQYWNVKTLVYMALLIALHLILTRVFVIELGAYRISVGSVSTILAGLWLGPVAGGVCGLCSDLIGCMMKGYAVNPFITHSSRHKTPMPALLMADIKSKFE